MAWVVESAQRRCEQWGSGRCEPDATVAPWAMYGGAGAANVVIELWIAATAAAQPGTGAEEHQHRGIEKTMMSTVLGMLIMVPVVFGVGGYALVSRRP